MNDFLKKSQSYVWYQDEIFLSEHMLVGPFQFGSSGRKKLKYPNIINDKKCRELDKEGRQQGINISDTKEVVPLVRV